MSTFDVTSPLFLTSVFSLPTPAQFLAAARKWSRICQLSSIIGQLWSHGVPKLNRSFDVVLQPGPVPARTVPSGSSRMPLGSPLGGTTLGPPCGPLWYHTGTTLGPPWGPQDPSQTTLRIPQDLWDPSETTLGPPWDLLWIHPWIYPITCRSRDPSSPPSSSTPTSSSPSPSSSTPVVSYRLRRSSSLSPMLSLPPPRRWRQLLGAGAVVHPGGVYPGSVHIAGTPPGTPHRYTIPGTPSVYTTATAARLPASRRSLNA